jgi:APA family basic amino acid/polyamine antiporter
MQSAVMDFCLSYMKEIDKKHRTPKKATYTAGIVAMIFAGAFPLDI